MKPEVLEPARLYVRHADDDHTEFIIVMLYESTIDDGDGLPNGPLRIVGRGHALRGALEDPSEGVGEYVASSRALRNAADQIDRHLADYWAAKKKQKKSGPS